MRLLLVVVAAVAAEECETVCWNNTSIAPWDCDASAPLQIFQKTVHALEVATGDYAVVFEVGGANTTDVEAAGLLETVDGAYYAMAAFRDRLCRFDSDAAVCFDDPLVVEPKAGTMLGTTYYYAEDAGKVIYAAQRVNAESLTVTNPEWMLEIEESLVAGNVLDIVAVVEPANVSYVDDGEDVTSYLLGLSSRFELVVVRLGVNRSSYAVIRSPSVKWLDHEERDETPFGAAFAYPRTMQGLRILFASDEGFGLFELEMPLVVPEECWNSAGKINNDNVTTTNINETHVVCDNAVAELVWLAPSKNVTGPTDGFNCPSTSVLDGLPDDDELVDNDDLEVVNAPTEVFETEGETNSTFNESLFTTAPSPMIELEPATVATENTTTMTNTTTTNAATMNNNSTAVPTTIEVLSAVPSLRPVIVATANEPTAVTTANQTTLIPACTAAICWTDVYLDSTSCHVYEGPLQILPLVDEVYSMSMLNLESGTYDLLGSLEFSPNSVDAVGLFSSISDEFYIQIGAFGDKLCRFDNKHAACFDSGTLKVPAANAGAVLRTSYFYAEGVGGDLDASVYSVLNVHTDSPHFVEDELFAVRSALVSGQVPDIAAFAELVEDDGYVMDNRTSGTYVVGLAPAFELLVVRVAIETGIPESYAVLAPAVIWSNGQELTDVSTGFGAAYAYGKQQSVGMSDLRLFFAADDGLGLFELETPIVVPEECWNTGLVTESHVFCNDGEATLVWRAPAAAIELPGNDGYNCPVATFYDAYPGVGQPTSVPTNTTFAPTYAPTNATFAPTYTPTEGTLSPTVSPTYNPTTIESIAGNVTCVAGKHSFHIFTDEDVSIVEYFLDGARTNDTRVVVSAGGDVCLFEGCFAIEGLEGSVVVLTDEAGLQTNISCGSTTRGPCTSVVFCVRDNSAVELPTSPPSFNSSANEQLSMTLVPTLLTTEETSVPSPRPFAFPTGASVPATSLAPSAAMISAIVTTALVLDFGSTANASSDWELSIANAVSAAVPSLVAGTVTVSLTAVDNNIESGRRFLQGDTSMIADVTGRGLFSDLDEERTRDFLISELEAAIEDGSLGVAIISNAEGKLAEFSEATLADSVMTNASIALVRNVTTVVFTVPSAAPVASATSPISVVKAPSSMPTPTFARVASHVNDDNRSGGERDKGRKNSRTALIVIVIVAFFCILAATVYNYHSRRNQHATDRAKRWRQLEENFGQELVDMDNEHPPPSSGPHPDFKTQLNALAGKRETRNVKWPSEEEEDAAYEDEAKHGHDDGETALLAGRREGHNDSAVLRHLIDERGEVPVDQIAMDETPDDDDVYVEDSTRYQGSTLV